tara:strand:- start:530 stop:859 length:330 start_codon:yes stop_codon:yes gene_type:complete
MNFRTGEPTHIEDYLVTVRTGCWFGWTDSKNKIYENLVVHDGGTKPSKEEVEAGFKALKDKWTAEEYKRKRAQEYPNMGAQLDYIYHNGIDKWKTDIVDPIKKKYPKPE